MGSIFFIILAMDIGSTVFPHVRPAGIIILCSLQMRVLLENTRFLLPKVIRIAGIISDAGLYQILVAFKAISYF
jgi:hypothetical protein